MIIILQWIKRKRNQLLFAFGISLMVNGIYSNNVYLVIIGSLLLGWWVDNIKYND
jgi:hypothetical protein